MTGFFYTRPTNAGLYQIRVTAFVAFCCAVYVSGTGTDARAAPPTPAPQRARRLIADAQRLAATIKNADGRIAAFASIAGAQTAAGDGIGARRTLLAEARLAETLTGADKREQILRGIVEAQSRMGDFAGALRTQTLLRTPLSRAFALLDVAAEQRKKGDAAGANATIAAAKPVVATLVASESGVYYYETLASFGEGFHLLEIAQAQIKAGDFAGARTTIAAAPRHYPGAKTLDFNLGLVAGERIQAGDSVGAAQTAALIKDAGDRARILETVIAARVAAGDAAGAKQYLADMWAAVGKPLPALYAVGLREAMGDFVSAKAIVNNDAAPNYDKTAVLRGIAQRQAERGDVSAARRTMDSLPTDSAGGDDEMLAAIAKAQAAAGEIAGAARTSKLLKGKYYKSRALSFVADAQAKAGDVAGALRTAAAIPDTDDPDIAQYKIFALIAAARARKATGDAAGAKRTLAAAQRCADAIRQDLDGALLVDLPNYRLECLNDVAAAQAQTGDIAAAKKTAAILVEYGDGERVLTAIAAAQAQVGNVAGAEQTLAGVVRASVRAALLAQTAVAVMDAPPPPHITAQHIVSAEAARTIAEAKIAVEGVDEPIERAQVLTKIAAAQAANNDYAGARATAAMIPDRAPVGALEYTMAPADDSLYSAETAELQSKEFALAAVAAARWKAGDRAGAERAFADARRIGNAMNYAGSRAEAYYRIGIAQIGCGDIAGARANLADAAAQLGSMERFDGTQQAGCLRDIATARARAGDAAGAHRTFAAAAVIAARISGGFRDDGTGGQDDPDWSLYEIAAAQAGVGDFSGVKRIVARNAMGSGRAGRTLVAAWIAAGDLAGARRVANAMEESYYRGYAFGLIAEATARRGSFADAERAMRVYPGADAAKVWADRAALQAKRGDRAGATESLRRALALAELTYSYDTEGDRADRLRRVGEAQAAAGDCAGAARTFKRAFAALGDGRRDPLLSVARSQAAAGDDAGARRSFEAAARLARKSTGGISPAAYDVAVGLCEVAVARTAAGYRADALRELAAARAAAARMLAGDDQRKVQILCAIAEAQTRAAKLPRPAPAPKP